MVLPNKISCPLVEDVPLKVFKCPHPAGERQSGSEMVLVAEATLEIALSILSMKS